MGALDQEPGVSVFAFLYFYFATKDTNVTINFIFNFYKFFNFIIFIEFFIYFLGRIMRQLLVERKALVFSRVFLLF